jgi:fumarylacetoacetate (FAA) hydrolase family protein
MPTDNTQSTPQSTARPQSAEQRIDVVSILPVDYRLAILLGRVQLAEGPTPIMVAGGRVIDVSRAVPTVSEFLERWPVPKASTELKPDDRFDAKAITAWAESYGAKSMDLPGAVDLGPIEDFDFAAQPLLAPFDLQCIKAAGVTFAASMIERVIEERARGDRDIADSLRQRIESQIGDDLARVVPGSAEAAKLKETLIREGLWSQYLEVAIGPDAEVFTKTPVLASVGHGAEVGVRSDSTWNNPEPEIVLACTSRGDIVGAALGNDVNLRDFEGRSALLLGKAKDNNASCAIGPFIRLFGDDFTLADVAQAEVTVTIEGEDGYRLTETGTMRGISRPPAEIARQVLSEHQYPDGFGLFLGSLFAPTADRDAPGLGFTHKEGDVVRIRSAGLGTLENRVTTSAKAARWEFGIAALMRNLASRNLLNG